MARYQEIADHLRRRIQGGEYPVGSKLPGISALQEEYDVPALNTIRAAQQLLVEEGMLTTRQGVGAFVTSTESLKGVDIVDTLKRASTALTTAINALETPKHAVTIDLYEDENTYFVLTEALQDFAHRQRAEAAREDDEDSPQAAWAATAEALLNDIEASL